MKVVTIVGARPQFVKAAVVSRALRAQPGVQEILVHTGQHYDEAMSEVFFQELEMPRPDHHLGIGSAAHGAQTGRMLEAIEWVLQAERPDSVVVYGDTNSTLAGALAAVKLHIPCAHVEAGLRSFNRAMPEEINRVLTDHASDLLFAPTRAAVENLRREGIPDARVKWVGDVMFDAARLFGEMAERTSSVLDRLGLEAGGYLLATVHRAENTDDPGRLRAIMEGLQAVSGQYPVVLPIHPRTRQALMHHGLPERKDPNLRLVEPVGYLDMVMLQRHARLVITDSGGLQKEAFFQGVPCATLRTETEWTELVKMGWNRLVPPENGTRVAEGLRSALASRPEPAANPYGDGHASEKIAKTLCVVSEA